MCIINAPIGYDEQINEIKFDTEPAGKLTYDFIQYFVTSKDLLEHTFPILKKQLKANGALWVSWPKKSAKKETDLIENDVMKIGLENGLVDVKVIAIDETWSGLKFVYRLKDRK